MTAKQQPEYFEELDALEIFLLRNNTLLTHQELKVLYAAMSGKTNAEIAEELCRSIATVKTHKNHIIRKLGLKGKEGFRRYLLKMAHIGFKEKRNQP